MSLAEALHSQVRKADNTLSFIIHTDNMLGRIHNANIMLGPDSKSLTKRGSSRLCRQEEVQTGC
jgi:hypothetical protein